MTSFAIEVKHASKRFGGVHAIQDCNLNIESRGITAIIGPNGAGKTTLFNLISGLYAPTAGEVLLFGRSIRGLGLSEVAAEGLVRTFQSARAFPGLTVRENVLAGATMHLRAGFFSQLFWTRRSSREERACTEQVDYLLELMGLSQFADADAITLPMGAQKLLEVARAVMARPRVLLLDEPAAGLNDQETAELGSLITALAENEISVVVVEHNMALVMGIADKVFVLDAGSVVAQGSPLEIQNDANVISAYLGAGRTHHA